MTFLKQNWFKLAIVMIFSAFGLYYFIVIMPTKTLEDKVSHCRNLGEEYRKNEIKENPSITFMVPVYTYNSDLDTCIYRGGFIDGKLSNGYIIDLNTNSEIVGFYYLDSKYFSGLTREEFNKKEEELFDK